MRRGTTPIITLEVDFDFTDWELYVTFKNGMKTITIENDGLTLETKSGKSTIRILLSQQQTLSFYANTVCKVQIRAYKDGIAVATDEGELNVEQILLDGVIGE